ncbi:glucan 1,4-alpha-glucosidase [Gemmatimonadetes bacterium T265]|nr:glucan 1,4-alpha-glucosidase [Gemmatimonadetes bacterium T265]
MPVRIEGRPSGERRDDSTLRPAAGAPGMEPRWTSSAKSGVGTALDPRSRVWFTLSHGVVNEVYYPRVDQAVTRDLGLLVVGPNDTFYEEKRDAASVVGLLAPGVPGYRLVNTARDGRWRVTKTVVSHPEHDVLLQHVAFELLGDPDGAADGGAPDAWRVFALLSPHVGNQGAGNDAWVADYKGMRALFAARGGTALALAASGGWADATAGYVGTSDGWQDVRAHGRLTTGANVARDGNVALCGEVDLAAAGLTSRSRRAEFVLSLGFGQNSAEAAQRARLALFDPFDAVAAAYVDDWREFLVRGTLHAAPDGAAAGGAPDLVAVSTAVLRTHEDQRAPGGMIASLSIPWGQSKGDHDLGGYHLIWPRDLVECAGGLLAAGHYESAQRTLRFLMATQEADGHWPQNMWLDGTPYWDGVQMDEAAFPILLADLAFRIGALDDLDPWPMVRAAAAFLLRHGPVTQQDRWEEDAGYSPFTLAVEIAALLAAADVAERAGEPQTATVLREAADVWNAGVERWTYVTDTPLARRVGVAGYYARIAPPDVADAPSPTGPNAGFVPIKNRVDPGLAARYDAVVSPDALALVRFGLRHARDPRILDTVRVIDAVLRTETPTGPVWHRYNEDGYGEKEDGSPFDGAGIGRGWPLFAGERGHWALLAGDAADARRLLDTMARQASDGGLIPEQVWDAPDLPERDLYCGRPAGSAMPLAWAHAEYLKLARSLADGAVFDLPPQPVVRYLERGGAPGGSGHTSAGAAPPAPRVALWAPQQKVRTMRAGQLLRVLTLDAALVHWTTDNWTTTHDTAARPVGTLDLFAADLDAGVLRPGDEVRFTIRWADARAWAGEDWTVTVEAPPG